MHEAQHDDSLTLQIAQLSKEQGNTPAGLAKDRLGAQITDLTVAVADTHAYLAALG